MQSDREACLAAGMNDHIGKPFELRQLIAVLLQWTHCPVPPSRDMDPEPVTLGIPPGFDGFEPVQALQRLGNDVPLLLRLLGRFVDDLQTQASWWQVALREPQPDVIALRRVAHTIKGTAATLGVVGLAGSAAHAERALGADAGVLSDPTRQLATAWGQQLSGVGAQLAGWYARATADAVAPAPPASRVSMSPADRVEMLDELCACLRASDMEAHAWLDRLTHTLDDDVAQQVHWQQFARAMHAFDFDVALHAAQALREAWLYPSKSEA